MVDKVQDSKVHKEWWLLTHEKLTKIYGGKTESADNHFDEFDDYLEMQ